MTEKQQKIINTALVLFATEGFNAVSTSKIAKTAGVSEGLIFKHFENKQGLLDAITKDAELKISQVFTPILFESDPKEIIKKTIALPFNVNEKDYNFWRLQFKLKWETNYHNPDKMKPVLAQLEQAFQALGYKEPAKEAMLLNQIIESISTGILRDGLNSQAFMQEFLTQKYSV